MEYRVTLLRALSLSLCLLPGLTFPALTAPSIRISAVAGPPLFHGNWCGVGDANRASPVDVLDAACREHDLCYERHGRGSCICDRAILRATASIVRRSQIPEPVRSKAATVNSLFSAALCTENPKMP
jgi:Phospholipase A2